MTNPHPVEYWERLREFAQSDRQHEFLDALIKCGTYKAAAAWLGVAERGIYKSVSIMKDRAAKRGYAPEHDMIKTVPDGFTVKGTSTLYDDAGQPKIQWVKTQIDHERQLEMMREAVHALCEEITPRTPRPLQVKQQNDNLNLFILTDYHLGMLAWEEETRDDPWDIHIAEQLIYDWIAYSIEHAPDAEVGVFAQLGDFLHWDGLTSVTPASGHVLDADTRFQKVVRVAIRTINHVVDSMLEKHNEVILLLAEGNHDPSSSVWLREMFDHLYRDEPRVDVITDPDPYYCVEHGNTSLFFHHGHKKNMSEIDRAFAAKFREVFGSTKYSYAHMGHYHHVKVNETSLMHVEQHPTLASKDAYASRGGYLSMRSAPVITYHRKYGEVGRLQVKPEMLKEKHNSRI